jgi:hypothetical protein
MTRQVIDHCRASEIRGSGMLRVRLVVATRIYPIKWKHSLGGFWLSR